VARFNDLVDAFNEAKLGTKLTRLSSTAYIGTQPNPLELLTQVRVALQLIPDESSTQTPSNSASQIPESLLGKKESQPKPTAFSGCSVEGLPVAKVIQLNLAHSVSSTIWSQGVFGLSQGTLETLVNRARSFKYAILVLTPDDVVIKRDQPTMSARDNVLFELGLFMGALGREYTFIVCRRDVKMPTDLAGITPATYDVDDQVALQANLGPVSTQIEIQMGLL
jgi:predicted nucleotide-binding protein